MDDDEDESTHVFRRCTSVAANIHIIAASKNCPQEMLWLIFGLTLRQLKLSRSSKSQT